VAIFGERLGLSLTLKDAEVAAYAMLREPREKEAPWAKPPAIPVWHEDLR
jgi:hypothetical protein